MSLEDDKKVQYYAAIVNAWFETRMEHDRALLNLSVAAVGLIATLLTTVNISSRFGLCLFMFSLLSFSATGISIILIFRRNADYLERLYAETKTSESDARSTQQSGKEEGALRKLDGVARLGFIIGISLLALAGAVAALT